MCENSWQLYAVPDRFKTKRMCEKAVKDDFSSLMFVSDWFVTREWVGMWHDDYYDDGGGHWDDDDDDDDENNLFGWCNGYRKHKARRQKLKRALTYCLAPIKVVGLVCS